MFPFITCSRRQCLHELRPIHLTHNFLFFLGYFFPPWLYSTCFHFSWSDELIFSFLLHHHINFVIKIYTYTDIYIPQTEKHNTKSQNSADVMLSTKQWECRWKAEESRFNFRQDDKINLFTKTSRLSVVPTQTFAQWVLGIVSSR